MYSEKDLRDQWSYRLNISDEKKAFIVSHIWEVLGVEFKYFFFNRNCGYYVADTFQLIIDEPLMQYGLPWAFPSAIFDYVSTIKNEKGESLVESVTFYPSRQTRFYQKYEALSPSLKAVLTKSINSGFSFNTDSYTTLNVDEKVAVLDALLDYNAYLNFKAKGKDTELKEKKKGLILERLKLNTKSPDVTYEPPIAPHFGQRPTKLALGTIEHSERGSAALATFRGAYYDHLSLSGGRPQHSLLRMAELNLMVDSEALTVRDLTFVEIEKLGITKTGLPRDAGHTWHLDLGVYRRSISDTSATDWTLTGGYGKAKKVSGSNVGFVMLDSVVVLNDVTMSYLSPRLSLVTIPHNAFASQVSTKWTPSGLVTELEGRLGSSRTSDIRLKFSVGETVESQLVMAYYF